MLGKLKKLGLATAVAGMVGLSYTAYATTLFSDSFEYKKVIFKNEVDVIDTSKQGAIKSIDSTDVNHTNLTVADNNPIASKKSGDIFYLPDENGGAAFKVVEIINNPDGTKTVKTEPPRLSEVISSYKGNTKLADNIKPKLLGVIGNPNTVVMKSSDGKTLQKRIIKVDFDNSRGEDVDKLSFNLDFYLSVPKDKYKNNRIYNIYQSYCAYPNKYVQDKRKEGKNVTYTDALAFTDTICNKKFKISGNVDLKLGTFVDTFDLNEKDKKISFKKGQNQEFSIRDNEWSYKIDFEILDKNFSISKLPLISKIYAENMFKDFEIAELKLPSASVAVTGLSSQDKRGKIPLAGAYLGLFGNWNKVKGSGLAATNKLLSVEGGGVLMLYLVFDVNGQAKLQLTLEKEPEKFDVGIKYEDDTLQRLSNSDKKKSDTTLALTVDYQGQIKAGLAAEADFFAAGVRFANIGLAAQGQLDGKISGGLQHNFTTGVFSGNNCVSLGYGYGLLAYGGIDVGLEGKVEIGFVKRFNIGFGYDFMIPSIENQTNPSYNSLLWNYQSLIGAGNKEVCTSTTPPDPEIISIEPNHARRVKLGAATYVPVKIKVRNNNEKHSIKYWHIGNDNPQLLKEDENGYIHYIAPDEAEEILLPYGAYSLDVEVYNYSAEKFTLSHPINLGEAPKPLTVTEIKTDKPYLIMGKDYTVTVSGEGLPKDTKLLIDGCEVISVVQQTDSKHIYSCKARNNVANHSISIKSFRDNTVLKSYEINVLDISLNKQSVNAGEKYQVNILGNALSPYESFVVDGCVNKKIIKLMPEKHIYECDAPNVAGNKLLTIKTIDGLNELTTVTVQVEVTVPVVIIPTKLNDTGITKCGTADGTSNTVDCSTAVANATGSQVPLGQNGHYGTGKNGSTGMSFTKIDANGNPLADSASDWKCAKDNHTGLMWEVKTDDGGLHDKDNTYTWYSTSNNRGNAGTQNGGTCSGSNCDTAAFVNVVNSSGLCGHNDWRLPTRRELRSIVDYSRYNPSIDTTYFPKAKSSFYWSSSPYASVNNVAWGVNFDHGDAHYGYKSSNLYVCLVRGGQ